MVPSLPLDLPGCQDFLILAEHSLSGGCTSYGTIAHGGLLGDGLLSSGAVQGQTQPDGKKNSS